MFLCRVCPPRPPYFLRFADSPAAPSQPFQARQHAQTPPSPHSSSTSARFHAPRLPSWPAASPCAHAPTTLARPPALHSARRPTPPCLSTRLALPHRPPLRPFRPPASTACLSGLSRRRWARTSTPCAPAYRRMIRVLLDACVPCARTPHVHTPPRAHTLLHAQRLHVRRSARWFLNRRRAEATRPRTVAT